MGVSVDSSWAHKAFQEKLGIEIPLLADFHPKGEVSAAPNPGEIPGANLIFDALAALG